MRAGTTPTRAARRRAKARRPTDGAGPFRRPARAMTTLGTLAAKAALSSRRWENRRRISAASIRQPGRWQHRPRETLAAATIWRASRRALDFRRKSRLRDRGSSGPARSRKYFDECIASHCSGQGEVGNPFASQQSRGGSERQSRASPLRQRQSASGRFPVRMRTWLRRPERIRGGRVRVCRRSRARTDAKGQVRATRPVRSRPNNPCTARAI